MSKQQKSVRPRGAFVGLVAVAPARYRVVTMRTDGESVVEAKAETGAEGLELHVALVELNVQLQRHVRDGATALWRPRDAG